MNYREVIWLVVIGILIAVCSFLGIQSCSKQKKLDDSNLKLTACLNAPKTSDTVYDTIHVYDTTWIRLKGKTIVIHDTAVKWCQSFFDSTYKFTNTFGSGRIHYRIDVRDCQASIQFPEVVSPKEVITITNTVDTCLLKPPEYKAKLFHWGLYADLTAHDFKVFPGVGAGGQLIFKDQVTIGAGALYMDKWYGNVRIGVLFK